MTAPVRPSWRMNCARLLGLLSDGRVHAGMTQLQVADALGLSLRTFKRFEAGDAEPRLLQLFRWADIVGVDIFAAGRWESANPGTPVDPALANVTALVVPAGASLPHDFAASGPLMICGENAASRRAVHGKSRRAPSHQSIGAAA